MSKKRKKEKILKTKIKGAKFIKFSEIQRKYLTEVRGRQMNEFNIALESVYQELGIIERIEQAPLGTYRLRMRDLSGLDIIPSPPAPREPDPPPNDEPLPPPGKKEEDKKDN